MKHQPRFVCVGGPFDGDSPPWADGRPEIRYPQPPALTARVDEFDPSKIPTENIVRYLLTRLVDGRTVYLYELLRPPRTPLDGCRQ